MSEIKPFMALRPHLEFAVDVAALPYDVLSSDEARLEANPFSFLHVDKAEIDLPQGTDLYSDEVYKKAKENFGKMIADGIISKDTTPCYYIYLLTMGGRRQYGIVACASIDEYLDGRIKKHELTLSAKEDDRARHVDALDAQTGPIFLTYRRRKEIDEIVSDWTTSHAPVYDFTSKDWISHTAWVVDAPAYISAISRAFLKVPALYIADGHHRNAGAARVALKRRETHGAGEHDYCLSVIFPDNQLKILDYNRLVRDLNGFSPEGFLEELKKNFAVEKFDGRIAPKKPHTFSMYMGGSWYVLKAKTVPADLIESLDVSILQKRVLSELLGIDDPRTDKRVDFVGGIRGLAELERRVNEDGWAAAFAMYPTSLGELLEVADAGLIMPPKSTWFEPKLRSGLFMHRLK
ncbi:MAG: DUF1015 family protein [Clostridiales bacterium]|jgi:uncharacterized protein (DUF1015 family)|nr:DUF1015 family protein [Clostridiales bacterium]